MPTERLSRRRIRDLLRLTFENGLSNRQVAASLGLSKGAVSMYLRRARAAGVTWPLPEELTDTALERLLFPGVTQAPEALRPMPNWPYVDAELRRPNVTRALLWEEYRTGQPDAYSYTWFGVAFDAWEGKVSASMRQRHAAGEKVFVDYAGSTIDASTREPAKPAEREVPAGKTVHAIMDNYATHKHPKVIQWLGHHPRWTFHFTPTSASWLNAVDHNQQPKPFIRTADPEKIISAAARGHQALDSIQSSLRVARMGLLRWVKAFIYHASTNARLDRSTLQDVVCAE